MTNTNEAGTPTTAPCTATETAVKKTMVLAVHRNERDEIVLTPIDVEHDHDDQSSLSEAEVTLKRNLFGKYLTDEDAMKRCLGVLYDVFEKRLYREQFRNFENWCFSMYGMYRVGDTLAAKARVRVKKLDEEREECR